MRFASSYNFHNFIQTKVIETKPDCSEKHSFQPESSPQKQLEDIPIAYRQSDGRKNQKNSRLNSTGSCCMKGCLIWAVLFILMTVAALVSGTWTFEWHQQAPPVPKKEQPQMIPVRNQPEISEPDTRQASIGQQFT